MFDVDVYDDKEAKSCHHSTAGRGIEGKTDARDTIGCQSLALNVKTRNTPRITLGGIGQ